MSFNGFTSALTGVSATVGGVAVTGRVTNANGTASSNDASVWMGTVRGVATGSAVAVVVTWTGGGTVSALLGFVADLTGWDGTAGVLPSAVYLNTVNATGPTVTGTVTGSGSLLVGMSALMRLVTLTATGWTNDGSAFDSTLQMTYWHKTGGAAGASESLTPTQAGGLTTRWGDAWLEIATTPATGLVPPMLLPSASLAATSLPPLLPGA